MFLFKKRKKFYSLGMSKTCLNSCIAFPQKLESFPIKSLSWILSRNFRLRTDKHPLTKVLKCFILSHDLIFNYILSGHGYMSRHLIEVYVSQVISNVSKHNKWYSKEEKPRLRKRKLTYRQKDMESCRGDNMIQDTII